MDSLMKTMEDFDQGLITESEAVDKIIYYFTTNPTLGLAVLYRLYKNTKEQANALDESKE